MHGISNWGFYAQIRIAWHMYIHTCGHELTQKAKHSYTGVASTFLLSTKEPITDSLTLDLTSLHLSYIIYEYMDHLSAYYKIAKRQDFGSHICRSKYSVSQGISE